MQNVFRHIVRKAEEIGMVVNSAKTAMICTSGATDYKADAYILDADGDRISCAESIKVLGVRFSSDLSLITSVPFHADFAKGTGHRTSKITVFLSPSSFRSTRP